MKDKFHAWLDSMTLMEAEDILLEYLNERRDAVGLGFVMIEDRSEEDDAVISQGGCA